MGWSLLGQRQIRQQCPRTKRLQELALCTELFGSKMDSCLSTLGVRERENVGDFCTNNLPGQKFGII